MASKSAKGADMLLQMHRHGLVSLKATWFLDGVAIGQSRTNRSLLYGQRRCDGSRHFVAFPTAGSAYLGRAGRGRPDVGDCGLARSGDDPVSSRGRRAADRYVAADLARPAPDR